MLFIQGKLLGENGCAWGGRDESGPQALGKGPAFPVRQGLWEGEEGGQVYVNTVGLNGSQRPDELIISHYDPAETADPLTSRLLSCHATDINLPRPARGGEEGRRGGEERWGETKKQTAIFLK